MFNFMYEIINKEGQVLDTSTVGEVVSFTEHVFPETRIKELYIKREFPDGVKQSVVVSVPLDLVIKTVIEDIKEK